MRTNPTPYTDVNTLLELILTRLLALLGNRLVGLSVFGSLVVGDFDHDSSDIDLVAALTNELDDEDVERLRVMHEEIDRAEQAWAGRIEIGYIVLEHLQNIQEHFPLVLTSPGEPLHAKIADADWIINRFVLREKGFALYGPEPATFVAPISRAELTHAVQVQVRAWYEWIYHNYRRPSQGYAILTMCRAFYILKTGDFVSKKQAALWTMQQLPEWAALIQNALTWRANWRDEQVDHEATFAETVRFVHYIIDLCECRLSK